MGGVIASSQLACNIMHTTFPMQAYGGLQECTGSCCCSASGVFRKHQPHALLLLL
jgi:hypothetical protein